MLVRAQVRSVERLSPSFLRLVLGGDLDRLGVGGPLLDQRIKLLFPTPAGLPQLRAQCWWEDFQALPEETRGAVRTYTLRAVTSARELVVDVVLHPGAHGPGSSWASAARPGDELLALVPSCDASRTGVEWAPGDADRLLIVADETAVPAACSILSALPARARGTAILEVPVTADEQRIPAPDGVSVRWLPREGRPVGALAAVAVAELFGGAVAEPSAGSPGDVDPDLWETPTHSSSGDSLVSGPSDGCYAWVAGESGMVTAIRRHLVGEVGLPRHQVAFMGYWRQGVAMRG